MGAPNFARCSLFYAGVKTNYIVPSRLTKRLFRVNLIIQKKGSTVDGLPD